MPKMFRTKKVLLITALVIVASVAIAYAMKDKGKWIPERLAPWSIEPGESRLIDITLEHQGVRDIIDGKVSFGFSDNVAEFVYLKSVTNKNTSAENNEQNKGDGGNNANNNNNTFETVFTFEIIIPQDTTFGVVNGSATLLKQNDKPFKHIPALPVEITVFNKPLPPDPHAELDKTVEGVDVDSDGRWDYWQRYVEITYADEPRIIKGLSMFGVASQEDLLNVNDRAASVEKGHIALKRVECIEYWMFNKRGEDNLTVDEIVLASGIRRQLQSVILNNKARSEAYNQADKNFSGQMYTGMSPDEINSFCGL